MYGSQTRQINYLNIESSQNEWPMWIVKHIFRRVNLRKYISGLCKLQNEIWPLWTLQDSTSVILYFESRTKQINYFLLVRRDKTNTNWTSIHPVDLPLRLYFGRSSSLLHFFFWGLHLILWTIFLAIYVIKSLSLSSFTTLTRQHIKHRYDKLLFSTFLMGYSKLNA